MSNFSGSSWNKIQINTINNINEHSEINKIKDTRVKERNENIHNGSNKPSIHGGKAPGSETIFP